MDDQSKMINAMADAVRSHSRVNLVIEDPKERTALLRELLKVVDGPTVVVNALNHPTDLLDKLSDSSNALFVVDAWDPGLLAEELAPEFQQWFHKAGRIVLATDKPVHQLRNPNAEFITADELERFRIETPSLLAAKSLSLEKLHQWRGLAPNFTKRTAALGALQALSLIVGRGAVAGAIAGAVAGTFALLTDRLGARQTGRGGSTCGQTSVLRLA